MKVQAMKMFETVIIAFIGFMIAAYSGWMMAQYINGTPERTAFNGKTMMSIATAYGFFGCGLGFIAVAIHFWTIQSSKKKTEGEL